MATRKRKSKDEKQAVNRPFVVNALGGPLRYGVTGGAIQVPLAVKVVGNDGRPPHDANGESVPLRVRFETVKVPEGAEEDLVSGSPHKTVRTDDDGRASAGAHLSRLPGAYGFAASLPDFDDGVDAAFTALTEAAVAVIQVAPVAPTSVDRRMRVDVKALDWQGRPVSDARLEAALLHSFQQDGADLFEATRRRGGRYSFSIRSRIAGTIPLEILDLATDTRVQVPLTFLQGAVRRVDFRNPEDPRERPPFDQTQLDVVASDRFGNLVSDVKVEWEASSGSLETVAHGPGVSASAVFRFGEQPEVEVVGSVEGRKARAKLRLAGTYVRLAELQNFAFVGEPFKVWIEIFPPPGGGVVRGFVACLREPVEAARRTGFSQPNPKNGVPEPRLREGDRGRLDLSVDDMSVSLPESGGRLLVAELCYDCSDELPACFDTLEGTITVARSPDEEQPLPPGFRKCPDQKRREPKRLCLNICIAVKPGGGKTFEDLKREVERQVRRTQEIFDENIEICCPKVEVKSCINELPWAEYRRIFEGGDVPGALEQVDEGATINTDATKDKLPLSSEVKNLLKKCRKEQCVSIYYVPDHRFKSGASWYRSNAVAIPPNDFPETTGAAGSGPGLVFSQGLSVGDHTLAHELGHLLIDFPRDQNNGDEHVGDSNADRVMKRSAPGGRKFTRAECARIFSNIGKYDGDC